MNRFEDNFQGYDVPYDKGVKMPTIQITKKDYEKYGLKDGATNSEFLKAMCKEAVIRLGINKKENKKEYYARIKMELDMFDELGFVDYVLLNWDVISNAKDNGIAVGLGRGSAAGSLVLYLLGVTGVDSSKHELFFERFVSKSRAKKFVYKGETYFDGSLMMDVDNDISYDRRHEVIKYIEEQYAGKTAKILTINTLTGKLCIKECGKIIEELSEDEVNHISSLIPKTHGKVHKLSVAYEESDRFKSLMDQYPAAFKLAKKLEGLNKNAGVHPSGIAISKDDITDVMPLQLTGDGALVSGYDMNAVSELAVKFDILGLRTLTVVDRTLKMIGKKMEDIDVEDPSIYQFLQDFEDPQGLFQIEADTNFKVCRDVRPQNLEHLSAVLALARPGALDYVDDYVNYRNTGEAQDKHPIFKDVLDYTGGIALYQEQLMKMATKIGFSLDEAEMLRRIVGKKKLDEVVKWKKKIEEKVKENNLDTEVGDILWKVAEDSASYSFNKSHSISYACLAAITIYLKKHHPMEFYVSLLEMAKSEPDPYVEIQKVSQELSRQNIKLLPPDLMKSRMEFSACDKGIRYGLSCMKGVGEKELEHIVELRESNSEIKNKFDLFSIAKECKVNIGALSALIYAGALDSLKLANRTRNYMVLEAQAFNLLTPREKREFTELGEEYDYQIIDMITASQEEELLATDGKLLMKESRFETFRKKIQSPKEIYMKNKQSEKLAIWYFESVILGYSYSNTLRDAFPEAIARTYIPIHEASKMDKRSVKIVGTVTDCVKAKAKKSGNPYFRMTIVDETGTISAMIMDNNRKKSLTEYEKSGKILPEKGEIVSLLGQSGGDIVFVNEMHVVNRDVYLKFSEIKIKNKKKNKNG